MQYLQGSDSGRDVALSDSSRISILDRWFQNWKKAIERFRVHDKSDCHRHAIAKIHMKRTQNVEARLKLQLSAAQKTAQQVLSLLFASVQYLGQQGFPLRGHENKDGGLYNLVHHRAKTDRSTDVIRFIEGRSNWLSPVIQNEVIEMFGRSLLLDITNELKDADFIGLVADGTTDQSSSEQFSLCLQYVDTNMATANAFVGFYDVASSTGEALALVVKDVLLRFNIPMTKLSGFSFDTAANMSGRHKGVQRRLKDLNPTCVYIPCVNHSLDLVLQEAARDIPTVADILDFVKGVANAVNESAKRTNLHKSLFKDGEVVKKPLSIAPTRWCVRASAMARLLGLYKHMLDVFCAMEDDRGLQGEARSRITGLVKKAELVPTYVALALIQAIFQPCEEVAAVLQGTNGTARSALQSVSLLRSRLQKLRAGGLSRETELATEQAAQLELVEPVVRRRKTPARIRNDDRIGEDFHATSSSEAVRLKSLEALDLVIAGRDSRFDSDDIKVAAAREEYVMEALSSPAEELETDDLNLPACVDTVQLKCELKTLSAGFERCPTNLQEVCAMLNSMEGSSKAMFREVKKALSLILSLPCTVASCERSFSMLRRLKTYLRATIGQRRLNHLALMQIYRDRLENVDVMALQREFVKRTPERMRTFGSV